MSMGMGMGMDVGMVNSRASKVLLEYDYLYLTLPYRKMVWL